MSPILQAGNEMLREKTELSKETSPAENQPPAELKASESTPQQPKSTEIEEKIDQFKRQVDEIIMKNLVDGMADILASAQRINEAAKAENNEHIQNEVTNYLRLIREEFLICLRELDTYGTPAPVSPEKDPNPTETLKNVKDSKIQLALDQCNGNVTQAAKILGMGRSTLYRYLNKSRSEKSAETKNNKRTQSKMGGDF